MVLLLSIFLQFISFASAALPAAKFLDIDGDRVAYFESRGTRGPGILLIHANSLSSESFAEILEGPVGQTYRVVSIDLPGHGQSDRARNPGYTYTLPGFAHVVVSAARALNMESGVFVGWSLGGHTLMEAIPQLPYAKGMVIVGAPPISRALIPGGFRYSSAHRLFFQGEFSSYEKQQVVRLLLSPSNPSMPELYFHDLDRADPNMRRTLGRSVLNKNYSSQQYNVANMRVPIAMFLGQDEQLVDNSYVVRQQMPTLWNNSVILFPNAGHAVMLEAREQFETTLMSFIRDVTQ